MGRDLRVRYETKFANLKTETDVVLYLHEYLGMYSNDEHVAHS
jgi:hypothetical protein